MTSKTAIFDVPRPRWRRPRTNTSGREMLEDMPTPSDPLVLAYLAGITDGEGCISIYGDGRTSVEGHKLYRLCFAIAMQHRPILELFVSTFGGKIYISHTNSGVHRTPYWRVPYMCHKAARVLSFLQPYLRAKAEQADLAIRFQTTRLRRKGRGYLHPPAYYEAAEEMKCRMAELNHQDSVSLRRRYHGSS